MALSPPSFPPRSLPKRDQIVIVTALVVVTGLAWVYLLYLSAQMSDMDTVTTGSVMQLRPWTPTHFVFMFLMWAIMMVGMMVPSAVPMTLIYAALARKAARQGTPIAPTAAFVWGYVVMWCLFSFGATLAQWVLHQTALLSPMMVTSSEGLGAALLMIAGIYQITPWKDLCLQHCRSPAHFIAEHWRTGVSGAFRMGLEHGAFCLGCCWALMGLLFFGGVMNLLWIAGITLFVFFEKVLPFGTCGGRLAGGGMILVGVVGLASWLT